MLSLMKRADYYSERGVMLDSDISNMMYDGKITYSATRTTPMPLVRSNTF